MAAAYRKLFIGWVALAGLAGFVLVKPGFRRVAVDYQISQTDIAKIQFSWANVSSQLAYTLIPPITEYARSYQATSLNGRIATPLINVLV